MQLDERLIIAPIRATKSGLPGPVGPQGPKGDKGADGLPPDHRWVDTSLQFKLPSGSWGPMTDLQGPQGPAGPAPSNKINVTNQDGNKRDLRLIKYDNTDPRVSYDESDSSLTIGSVRRVDQLDWDVETKLELPTGAGYSGVIIYVKSEKTYYHNDGTDWKQLKLDEITAETISNFFVPGKWSSVELSADKRQLSIGHKESFLGVFDTLDDLTASTLVKVSGQSFAIVRHPDNVIKNEAMNAFYVYKNTGWEQLQINGNMMYVDTTDRGIPITHIKAGDNVTFDYDATKHQITINSTGGGGGVTPDLDKYVKGENVTVIYDNDWAEVEWDQAGKLLKVGVTPPDFAKMNGVLVAGDGIEFERDDATNLLKIKNNKPAPDVTKYVKGDTITVQDGIDASWNQPGQRLTIGYKPEYTDLSKLFEAGNNVTIEKGTGEKLKINATPPAPPVIDLAPYAKKANIRIPAGYWGTVEVDGDNVDLKVGLTAPEISALFDNNADILFEPNSTKVYGRYRDFRGKTYTELMSGANGAIPLLQPGKNITLKYDDTRKTIEIQSDSQEFKKDTLKVTLPLTSTFDEAKHEQTVSLSPAAFVNLTDQAHSNVRVEYDAADNKIKYNVDPVIVPVVKVQKDGGAEAELSKLQVMNAGDAFQIQDDAANPGRKIGILTMHDKYQVIGHADSKDVKLTELTVRGDIPNQVAYTDDGKMTVDLSKSYFVGRYNSVGELPVDAVDNKSYAYVKSVNAYDTAYIRNGNAWVPHFPASGMLLVTPGATPSYDVIKQIKNNGAVSINNGELTINQGGVLYRHGGKDDALHTLEVDGAGVTANFDSATGALKLTVEGGGGGGTGGNPIKVSAKKQDGSVVESADVREILFDGDTESFLTENLPHGGTKVTLPVGIMVEVDSDLATITTKYDPTKYKGKLVYNYTNDKDKRSWYGCDGQTWFFLTNEQLTTDSLEVIRRLPAQAPKGITANAIKGKTGWYYFEAATADLPEYTETTGAKVRVDGYVMNLASAGPDQQTFYPSSKFQMPMYRNWDKTNNRWSDWVATAAATAGDIQGAIAHHNEQDDAHENVILPAMAATTRTTWYEITDNEANAKLKGVMPLMLMSDNTGHGKLRPQAGDDMSAMEIPRDGQYNIRWMFQITGATTQHGTLTLKIVKNNTDVITQKAFNISTQGEEFDAFKLKADSIQLAKDDSISVVAAYSGDTTWTELNKKEARIDAMKNYLVVEHHNSSSASHIADTFREILGGFVAVPGYEAQVLPDVAEESASTFVEVTGSTYRTKVVL